MQKQIDGLNRLAKALGLYDEDSGRGWRFAEHDKGIGLWLSPTPEPDITIYPTKPDFMCEIVASVYDAGDPPSFDEQTIAIARFTPPHIIIAVFKKLAVQVWDDLELIEAERELFAEAENE